MIINKLIPKESYISDKILDHCLNCTCRNEITLSKR